MVLFQGLAYQLEKRIVDGKIPDASAVKNRIKLTDQSSSIPLEEGDLGSEESTVFDHSAWDALLKRHISLGSTVGEVRDVNTVNYAALSKDPDFDRYLLQLEKANPTCLSKPEQLAFWMNAYNALCINLIVQAERKSSTEHVKSINDLSTPQMAVWDQAAGKVNGEDISLNTIEHEKLRKIWAEPAVHACIVCASASCPNLRPGAFTGVNLKEQMNEQMKDWLKNETKGFKMDGKRVVSLSRIFLWFHKDFGDWEGIRKWIPQFLPDQHPEDQERTMVALPQASTRRYFDYSWMINRTPTLTN